MCRQARSRALPEDSYNTAESTVSDTSAQTTPAREAPASGYRVDTLAAKAKELPDGSTVAMAGRLMLWRRFGGIAFGTLQDRSGRLQVAVQRAVVPPERFTEWTKGLRVGDFVGVTGKMWTTDKGERTVSVEDLTVLNRAVSALPDKWHGMSNPEARARKRYLDLLVNEVSRKRLLTRSAIVRRIRGFLDAQDFLEVETPILQAAASGAAARPFTTHHNALDEDLFLRISPETYLKRLVAGGLDRVYEIGRNFRNEGIDASHLQEFTMLEWYAAYWDYRDNMTTVRELVQAVLDDVLGTRVINYDGTELNFDGEWPELDYRDEVHKVTGVDLREVRDLPALRAALKSSDFEGVDLAAPSYAALVDQLYKKTVRPNLIQPCFLVGHPVELVPLARRSDGDPSRLDMFQVVANSWELVKAYSELVDPVDQRERLEEQARMRSEGDDETMMLEEDFLEAMEHGMPPMSGLGLGIDRFTALLTDAQTLRDVVFFPQLRRHEGQDEPDGTEPDGTPAEA
jgi:lysyl-tRNA synthetase class 2